MPAVPLCPLFLCASVPTVPLCPLFLCSSVPTVPLCLCTHCSSVPTVPLCLCTHCSPVPLCLLFLCAHCSSVPLYPLFLCSSVPTVPLCPLFLCVCCSSVPLSLLFLCYPVLTVTLITSVRSSYTSHKPSFLLPGVSIFPRRSQGKHWDPRENKTNCFARVKADIKCFVIHSEDEHGKQENNERSWQSIFISCKHCRPTVISESFSSTNFFFFFFSFRLSIKRNELFFDHRLFHCVFQELVENKQQINLNTVWNRAERLREGEFKKITRIITPPVSVTF